jgi:hypothetical protein
LYDQKLYKVGDRIRVTRSSLRYLALRKASQASSDKIFYCTLALRKINQGLRDYAFVFAFIGLPIGEFLYVF